MLDNVIENYDNPMHFVHGCSKFRYCGRSNAEVYNHDIATI